MQPLEVEAFAQQELESAKAEREALLAQLHEYVTSKEYAKLIDEAAKGVIALENVEALVKVFGTMRQLSEGIALLDTTISILETGYDPADREEPFTTDMDVQKPKGL